MVKCQAFKFKYTVNSLMPDFLQEMVNSAMEVREEKYISKRSIKMKILPEFMRMFDDTKKVSSKYLNHEAE